MFYATSLSRNVKCFASFTFHRKLFCPLGRWVDFKVMLTEFTKSKEPTSG